MDAITRQYLKLPEFCRLTGLSKSTVRRRVRDGSIRVEQLGGPKHILLFSIDALAQASRPLHSSSRTADSSKDHLVRLQGADAVNAPANGDTNQGGPGPKWKRELAALQMHTPKSITE